MVALFAEGGGQAIVAAGAGLTADVPLRRIGTVGGNTLLGVPVARLAEVHAT